MTALLLTGVLGVTVLAAAVQREPGGWLLMRAPLDGDGWPQAAEPLCRWHQGGAFDSAADCMREKVTLLALAYDREQDSDPRVAASWTMIVASIEAARCLPAGVVYRRDQCEGEAEISMQLEELMRRTGANTRVHGQTRFGSLPDAVKFWL